MNCREMSQFLAEYVAGELPNPVVVEFESHITACGDCHSFLAQYRTTIRAAGVVAAVGSSDPLPEAVVAAILAAVQKDDRRT